MSVMNLQEGAVAAAAVKAIRLAPHLGPRGSLPLSTVMTGLWVHGGAINMMDSDMLSAKLTPLLSALADMGVVKPPDIPALIALLHSRVVHFFTRLVDDKPLHIHTNLMSYLAFADGGRTHTPREDEQANPAGGDSTNVPAAFTFVGQFIDHDLTANVINLFDPQTGTIEDLSSPLIDLDSVYGPRIKTPPSPKLDLASLYDENGKFFLQRRADGVIDLPRDNCGLPFIADKRNDENQMVLQIHLLLMRLHNKIMYQTNDFDRAHKETVYTWQSIVMHDYLPKIVDPNLVELKKLAIKAGNYKDIKHAPTRDPQTGKLTVTMPHEFGIGFRFGHSQLRPSYKVNRDNEIVLFNNRLPLSILPGLPTTSKQYDDLRGGQPLVASHMIDWDYFLGGNGDPPSSVKSKLIDHLVTSVVFDLPESTIPDDIKAIGNLPHRNLIRSDQIGLYAGEDLADLYGAQKLKAEEVEPDPDARPLFMEDGSGKFRTPLWYYILREAELKGTDGRLGDAAGSLVAEVLLGGIYYNEPDLIIPDGWKSMVNDTDIVTLYELTQWVTGAANDALVLSKPFNPPSQCLPTM